MTDSRLSETPKHFVDMLRHFSSLMQGELALARAELGQNLSRAGVGVVLFVVAALLALVALNVLASALVAYLATTGLSVGLAALIVGGVLLLGAAIFAFAGKARLSADALAPKRTVKNLARDVESITEAGHA